MSPTENYRKIMMSHRVLWAAANILNVPEPSLPKPAPIPRVADFLRAAAEQYDFVPDRATGDFKEELVHIRPHAGALPGGDNDGGVHWEKRFFSTVLS